MEETHVLFTVLGLQVTGAVVTTWLIMLALIVLSLAATRNMRENPGRLQNAMEFALGKLCGMVEGIMGKTNARKCFPFLGTLFIFILVSNYTGLIPGAGTVAFFSAPTSSLSVAAALALLSFFAVHYYGLREHRLHYFKRFIKPFALMLPLMVIDELIKPLSLALRLYGNIFGEETVTHQIFTMAPLLVPVVMQVLSVLFCFLQAMVFTMLTAIYLNAALGEGH